MPGTLSSVGANSGYIPDLRASGNLQIEFSRNEDDFPLNKYIKTQPVTTQKGKYLRIDETNHSRLVGGNLDEYVWADGEDRPVLNNNGDQYALDDYTTIRRNFGERQGELATKQAQWNTEDVQMRTQSQKAMTARTLLVHRGLAEPTNWSPDNRIDVGIAAGLGSWAGALSSNPIIKRTLSRMMRQIKLSTNSTVKRRDMNLVINPTTANLMSETQEIIKMIEGSPQGIKMLRNDEDSFSEWLLPEFIYGFRIVVEDAVVTTSTRGAATTVRSFVMADAIAYLLSRPGGLESQNDGPNYSTATLMVMEDMNVEKFTSVEHRRTQVNVTDDVGYANTAPIAGAALIGLY